MKKNLLPHFTNNHFRSFNAKEANKTSAPNFLKEVGVANIKISKMLQQMSLESIKEQKEAAFAVKLTLRGNFSYFNRKHALFGKPVQMI